MEYVYIIGIDRISGMFKIGRTNKPPLIRLKELQIANPYELYLFHYIETISGVEIENYLHRKYRDKHIRGEWYQLTLEDLNNIARKFPANTIHEWTR